MITLTHSAPPGMNARADVLGRYATEPAAHCNELSEYVSSVATTTLVRPMYIKVNRKLLLVPPSGPVLVGERRAKCKHASSSAIFQGKRVCFSCVRSSRVVTGTRYASRPRANGAHLSSHV